MVNSEVKLYVIVSEEAETVELSSEGEKLELSNVELEVVELLKNVD